MQNWNGISNESKFLSQITNINYPPARNVTGESRRQMFIWASRIEKELNRRFIIFGFTMFRSADWMRSTARDENDLHEILN